ncbi:MAG: DNA polymerase III subunit gamma/tau [Planctomycetes bacterium]|nr:DNA polymerase III subunit gamma/tau [Planctomycetota bacterium]
MAKQKAKNATTPVLADDAAASPAEYTVVARRYRPQQFTDLVGQEPVARALMNAIQNDRVAHAYLFTGARGVGKTSAARILAKALNCSKGPTTTPCDQCEICKSIISGEDIDVLEIDGASNRGIDNVREIRQNVGTRPTRSRYKIYIIDEVHMLSKEAFNALLKTLEEPPPHVKFIFATTEIQKIPITILSRCQRFDFAGINSSRISERLKQVVAAEGMQADDAALMIVARRAGGSMRDAQSLLDQLLAFSGERLTAQKVHQLLGTATDERMLALVDAITARDAKLSFELLSRFAEEGLQLGELLDQLIDYWRSLMLLNCAGKDYADVSLADSDREKGWQHAQSLPLDSILAGLDILTTAKNRLRGSNHGLVLLEMTVLRLIRLDELVPVAQLAQWVGQGAATVPPATRNVAAKPGSLPEPAKKNSLTAPEVVSPLDSVPKGDLGLPEIWVRVRETVGPVHSGTLDAGGLPATLGPKSLVLRFDSRYTSQHDYCSDPKRIEIVQAALKEITGEDWSFRTELAAGLAESIPSAVPESQVSKAVTNRQRDQETMKIPLLNRAIEQMGARLLKVDEGFGTSNVAPVDLEPIEPQE